jgi:hypothetical protein
MKIVIYNSPDQYALSRAELEIIKSTLPRELWARIDEFHIAHSDPRTVEPFEYYEKGRIVYLVMPVKEKTPEIRTVAIKELLLGLARIQNKSRFFIALKPKERESYENFISEWLPKCEAALLKN